MPAASGVEGTSRSQAVSGITLALLNISGFLLDLDCAQEV